MNQHQHLYRNCNHAVEYCLLCKVVYCLNCDVTFYESLPTVIGDTGTWYPPYTSGTASDTFGGSDISVHMAHEPGIVD